jgi:hypothetical protein
LGELKKKFHLGTRCCSAPWTTFFADMMKAWFEFTLLLNFVRSIGTSGPLAGFLPLLVQATVNWIDVGDHISSFRFLGLTKASQNF